MNKLTKNDNIILDWFRENNVSNVSIPEIVESLNTSIGISRSSAYYSVNKLHIMKYIQKSTNRSFREPHTFSIITEEQKNFEIENQIDVQNKKKQSYDTIKMLRGLNIDTSTSDYIINAESPLQVVIDVKTLHKVLDGSVLIKRDTLDTLFNK